MAKLIKPVLFTQTFKISPNAIAAAGLFDPVLNSDSKLFIDPLLLSGSDNLRIRTFGHANLRKHLADVIMLIDASRSQGDVAWRSANRLLNLRERPETCLGYGGSGTSGSSRPTNLRDHILKTTKEIIELGEDNPEIITLMSMFEDGIGPDTISDLATNAIMPTLSEITEDFCKSNGVPTEVYCNYYGRSLPRNPYHADLPILLVPRDILRDLPLAADWGDVSRVITEIAQIRDAFSGYVGNITKATLKDKKRALRRAALSSIENFRAIFEAILQSSDTYDVNSDPLNLYRFRELLAADPNAFKKSEFVVGSPSSAELRRIVDEIIAHFRTMVEKNNLWELLWDGPKPKRERAAQLVFFAVAEMFCRANDIDVSPETNSGGGPVDFRFSKGYRNRIIVEIKLSKGQVVHGYTTQTRIYAEASQTDEAVFLVINVGRMGNKLHVVKQKQAEELKTRGKAPSIEVVDGRRRDSASVRSTPGAVIDDDSELDEDEDDGTQ